MAKIPKKEIDIEQALDLKFNKNMTDKEVGAVFGVSQQVMNNRLRRFKNLLLNKDELQAYENNKVKILTSAEIRLMQDIVDKERRDKASLNNTAYALTAVSNINRLEQGKSTSNISYADMGQSLKEMQAECDTLEAEILDHSDTAYMRAKQERKDGE